MTDASNPYNPSREAQTVQSSTRWPLRLTLALLGQPLLIMLSLPAVQASREPNLYNRTVGPLESYVVLIPAIVMIPALSISVVRSHVASRKAKLIATIFSFITIVYDAWLCASLLP